MLPGWQHAEGRACRRLSGSAPRRRRTSRRASATPPAWRGSAPRPCAERASPARLIRAATADARRGHATPRQVSAHSANKKLSLHLPAETTGSPSSPGVFTISKGYRDESASKGPWAPLEDEQLRKVRGARDTRATPPLPMLALASRVALQPVVARSARMSKQPVPCRSSQCPPPTRIHPPHASDLLHLMQLVLKLSPNKWSLIASQMQNRNGALSPATSSIPTVPIARPWQMGMDRVGGQWHGGGQRN